MNRAKTSGGNRTMTFKPSIFLTSLAIFVTGGYAQEIKFSEYIEPINFDEKGAEAKSTAKPVVAKGGFPLRFGMKTTDVEGLVGPPTGALHQGDKVTYSYPNGYVEFEHGQVIKMKWDGKYYTRQSQPEMARETAGALEINKTARPFRAEVKKASGSKKALGTTKGPPPQIRVIKGSSGE
ncbi:MAG: hypothetical protein ACI9TH_001719 [Kiritimatiellia bacterium]|jgi:hypothetical protein